MYIILCVCFWYLHICRLWIIWIQLQTKEKGTDTIKYFPISCLYFLSFTGIFIRLLALFCPSSCRSDVITVVPQAGNLYAVSAVKFGNAILKVSYKILLSFSEPFIMLLYFMSYHAFYVMLYFTDLCYITFLIV